MKSLKSKFIVLTLISLGLPVMSWAKGAPKITASETKMFGVGPVIGDPLGVNGKYWLQQSPMAVQGIIGYDLTDSALAISGDGLYHFKNVTTLDFPWDAGQVALYGGLGGKLSFPKKTRFTIRIPLGANVLYGGQDWDLFGELVPGIRVAPDSGGSFDFGVGMRYYF